jgi:excisionase family DNA binding protein
MKLLTVALAAEAMSLSETTVRALCARRKLRHERHGVGRGKILIPVDAIEEYRRGVTVVVVEAGGVARPKHRPRRPLRLKNLSLD